MKAGLVKRQITDKNGKRTTVWVRSGTDEKPSSKSAIDTANFKEWFKGSKVVDEKGKPLVVYHGTTKDFGAFSLNKMGGNTGKDNFNTHVGFYFTPQPELASAFTKKKWQNEQSKTKNNASIIPVYLSIKNPKTISAHQFTMGFLSNNKREDLIKEGYDGLIITPFTSEEKTKWDGMFGGNSGSIEFDEHQYVAFDSTQVKSAIGNSGKFDANNSDITKAI